MDNKDQISTEDERWKIYTAFPEEIWLIIFNTVEDANDLCNLATASIHFERMLKPVRKLYLFPKVLQILDMNMWINNGDTKSILNCRQTCSIWRKATDNFLSSRPFHGSLKILDQFPHPHSYVNDTAYRTYMRLYKFPVAKLENEILPEVGADFYQEHCPFPSRHLVIDEKGVNRFGPDEENPDIVRYRAATRQFLEKVGRHFWHFSLRVREEPLPWYTLLRDYLAWMPNVKCIFLDRCYGSVRRPWPELTRERESFPVLQNLEMVCANGIPGAILEHIFRSNAHVKIVDVRRSGEFSYNLLQVPKKISLTISSLPRLQRLPNWKLHALRLEFDGPRNEQIRLGDVFEKLESYTDCLQKMSIKLPRSSNDDYREAWLCSKRPLALPTLKVLDIQFTETRFTLDFLLGLKSLESFYFRVDRICTEIPVEFLREGIRSIIDFPEKCVDGNVMTSNIWDLIPSLKEICLKVSHSQVAPMKYKRSTPPMECTMDFCGTLI